MIQTKYRTIEVSYVNNNDFDFDIRWRSENINGNPVSNQDYVAISNIMFSLVCSPIHLPEQVCQILEEKLFNYFNNIEFHECHTTKE